MRLRNTILMAAAVMLLTAVSAFADHHMEKKEGRYYPLDTCFVTGEKLDEYAISMDVDGREVKVCCKMCVKKVNADKKQWMAKLDAAIIAQQDKDYPLETCPISGGKLGSMGEPVKLVIDNYLIKLCCAGCEKGIKKNPGPTLDKLSKFWEMKAMAASCEHCQDGKPCAMHADKHADCDKCEDGKPCAMHAEKHAGCAGCKDGEKCAKCAG